MIKNLWQKIVKWEREHFNNSGRLTFGSGGQRALSLREHISKNLGTRHRGSTTFIPRGSGSIHSRYGAGERTYRSQKRTLSSAHQMNVAAASRRSSHSGMLSQPYQAKLGEEIHRQRQESEAKMDQMYQEAKASIDAAYEAGLMSETEYNASLTDSRESIEAQTSDLMRRTTEGSYGRVNVGAVKGAVRDIEKSRVGRIAAGRRGVIRERGQRQVQAAQRKAGGYLDIMQKRQIPRYDIPQGFGRRETYRAMTGY